MRKSDRLIIDCLKEQIEATMELVLKYKDPGKRKYVSRSPFFMSLRLKEDTNYAIEASEGALYCIQEERIPNRLLWGEIRIGDYDSGCSKCCLTVPFPLDNSFISAKRGIWRESNEAIYEATKGLNDYINDSIGASEDSNPFVYLSHEDVEEWIRPGRHIRPDMRELKSTLKAVSRRLARKDIIRSSADFYHTFSRRYYVNSEGTVIVDNYARSTVALRASVIGENNLVYDNVEVVSSVNMNKLPDRKRMIEMSDELIEELYEIKDSPQEEPGTYPIIADGENHGVIWHEAIGHSLEGNRQFEDDDDDFFSLFSSPATALTFKDKIGKQVAPDFISVFDDPTLKGMDGSYIFDEEGVRSQRVCLIENGILMNYLTSREAAGKMSQKAGVNIRSNGHARSEGLAFASPRMSNIIVESQREKSMDELKEELFKICRENNKEYGLMIKGTIGGEVDTENSFFQTYPKNIYRIYPSGKTERVKGLYLVSTPYHILENIIATTSDYQVFNGSCGAESGWVPSTETAPDALIKSVEFGRMQRSDYEKIFPLLSEGPEI